MTEHLRRAVFLDRDGVINDLVPRGTSYSSPRLATEFRIAPEVPGLIARMRERGFLVFVVTNQPDVARGFMSREELDLMMSRLQAEIRPDDFRICSHDDVASCSCRKPSPGMLRELAATWNIQLAASIMVGDSWRDIEAGKRAGCYTILIGAASSDALGADYVASSLADAADHIDWLSIQLGDGETE